MLLFSRSTEKFALLTLFLLTLFLLFLLVTLFIYVRKYFLMSRRHFYKIVLFSFHNARDTSGKVARTRLVHSFNSGPVYVYPPRAFYRHKDFARLGVKKQHRGTKGVELKHINVPVQNLPRHVGVDNLARFLVTLVRHIRHTSYVVFIYSGIKFKQNDKK
ncbi:hypothetical protein FR483_n236R [Paramecium bursaria Chlorella virus FR483]|uniref:Uncharacterized protein n236R n=1 Tax=Paramecium bursaria Chlorella virus FR483 TaxID=399781 RepID=A7J6U0_PBCVF|nr:hypothetical protein FR483_n236R [Paramecium bursaria Chlorella virus FR483]ABT15521.1 hypothetical protein FR483_n236R [Paramecium bursaria Chlorella virus FR483]